MATYLIAGACGFIGANFVHFLVEREPDARVVAVDNLGFASNEPNLAAVRDGIVFEVGDIADDEQMTAIYSAHQPDFVVNFAAESHNDRAINGPAVFMRANALGAQTMLECSRRQPVARHLHVSTIEVYGELPADADYFTERAH
jgi:dTDP-glucose 4,6-dehydratase